MKRFLYISLYVSVITGLTLLFDVVFNLDLPETILCVFVALVLIVHIVEFFKHPGKQYKYPKQKRSPHPIIRMLQSDDDMYED
jgi:hypothetical protein